MLEGVYILSTMSSNSTREEMPEWVNYGLLRIEINYETTVEVFSLRKYASLLLGLKSTKNVI